MENRHDAVETPAPPAPERPMSVLEWVRAAIAGGLMGVANLIPGVSGGTMVLAMGIYRQFIDAVASVTALRLTWRRVLFLGTVGLCAAGAIVSLSGVILHLLFHHTIAMFALFIGLTLGGAPLLWRDLRPVRGDAILAVVVGFGLMIGVFMLREGLGFPKNTLMDFISGLVGATTMVLPGISGSYMLLVMDQYDRVVGAVRDLKDGLRARDATALAACMQVVVPVGLGAVIGVVALSNLLKVLLRRAARPTIGVLLGVLLGSVIGLWPFTQSVGEKALEDRSLAEIHAYAERWSLPEAAEITDKPTLIAHIISPDIWSRRTAPRPTGGEVGLALGMVAVGFATTFLLSRLGKQGAA